jgi:hypothetical protein
MYLVDGPVWCLLPTHSRRWHTVLIYMFGLPALLMKLLGLTPFTLLEEVVG